MRLILETLRCVIFQHALDTWVVHYNTKFSLKYSQLTAHRSPIRVRYICVCFWVYNLLAPEGCGSHSVSIIFILIIQNSSLGIHNEIAFRWMLQNLINKRSTLVQVMGCYSRDLHHCWPRSMLLFRPQWVRAMFNRLKAVLEGFVVTLYEGTCKKEVPVPRPKAKRFYVLFACAQVHCDNKTRQISLSHDYMLWDVLVLIHWHYNPDWWSWNRNWLID